MFLVRPKKPSKIKIVRENNETEIQIRKKSYNALSNLKKLLIRYSPISIEIIFNEYNKTYQFLFTCVCLETCTDKTRLITKIENCESGVASHVPKMPQIRGKIQT